MLLISAILRHCLKCSSPREVGNGTGIFEKGDASHEISSKEDYELCKEQVTSDSAVDKVTDHFKLVSVKSSR